MNERIELNPLICHGKPVIKNTRVLVSNIFADLAVGESISTVIDNYLSLTEDDIRAALQFGRSLQILNVSHMKVASREVFFG
jgi:uncharacterized protein (DUF433 family)